MASDIRLVDEEVFVDAIMVLMEDSQLFVRDIRLGERFLATTIPQMIQSIEMLEQEVNDLKKRLSKFAGLLADLEDLPVEIQGVREQTDANDRAITLVVAQLSDSNRGSVIGRP